MKHTQGKWEVSYVDGICIGVEAIIEKNEAGTFSQMVFNTVLPDTDEQYEIEKEEIEANAKLGAASKYLLEACSIALNYLQQNCYNDREHWIELEAAIKKATL